MRLTGQRLKVQRFAGPRSVGLRFTGLRFAALWFTALLLAVVIGGCRNGEAAIQYDVIYSNEKETQSQADPVAQETYTIGMVPKATENSYFNLVEDGAREAAADLGANLLYEGSPVADTGQQIRVIQSLISRKVDLIAVSANDSAKLLPVLREAKQSGIRVITWDSDTEPEGRELFVNMVDPETLGRHLLDALAMQMDEAGQYAILSGASTASNMNEWMKWIKAQNAQYYPDMKLVETAAANDDPQLAYTEAIRLMEKYPDLAGIIGTSSVALPAAAKALEDKRQAGSIHAVGLSTPNLMREYLKNGTVKNATLWSPKRLGYLTIVLAVNLLDGQAPVNGQVVRNVGEIRVKGDSVIMGEPLDFTKDNVDEYVF
ncbi:autoinducer 2 ABC transporter substrate-binding protein [Paenibacillus macerans]|uniref:autoinducer 2 ABC transporter substrate-binding protein n=1 Tax=Paenibacillus macerans TaxID=44252 RepID=UPI00203DE90F|nr:autoinducer 2 ABC transporter substrate-binding protein [Paenibacillus macerans]MCM3701364.1 autoinducer 2 ABC transporter substrate-binding protein [Paenibacillus macerans]